MKEQVKEIFLTESVELLDNAEAAVLRLEQESYSNELINEIFRPVHSIKGSAGIFGLARLETLLHKAETIIDEHRQQQSMPKKQTITLILNSIDTAKQILGTLAETQGDEETVQPPTQEEQQLLEKLDKHIKALEIDASETASASGSGSSSQAFIIELSIQSELEEQIFPPAIFEELESLGTVTYQFIIDHHPKPEAFLQNPYFGKWLISIDGPGLTKQHIEDVFIFNEESCTYHIESVKPPRPSEDAGDLNTADNDSEFWGFEDDDDAESTQRTNLSASKEENMENDKDKDEENGSTTSAPAANSSPALKDKESSTIRVNLDTLEKLMNQVSELVLNRNQFKQFADDFEDTGLQQLVNELNRLTSEIQETSMKTRMQPIKTIWARLPRVVRDLSLDLDKEINLKMEGESTELDRQVMQNLNEPLVHMIRNAIDHGVETRQERKEKGKPEEGTIHLNAFYENGFIIMEVSDDGRGLSIDKIKEKVLSSNLLDESTLNKMSEEQIQQLIFKPGFSTSSAVTNISGRGVGMDVVKTNIEQIGGTIEMSSRPEVGTTFRIKIPLTLAIVSALIFENDGYIFAIPELSINELVWINEENIDQCTEVNGAPVLKLRDTLLPLVDLSSVTNTNGITDKNELLNRYIVATESNGSPYGIIVDSIDQVQEIVVKSISKQLNHIPVYSGTSMIGSNDILLILDIHGIARVAEIESRATGDDLGAEQDQQKVEERERLLLFNQQGKQKAIPLSLVTRLEQIEHHRLEESDGDWVVNYRDRVLPLLWYKDDLRDQNRDTYSVILFDQNEFQFGLIVDDYDDIVEEVLKFDHRSNKSGVLGVMLINDIPTEIVDMGWYYNQLSFRKSTARTQGGVPDSVLIVEASSFLRNHLNMICKTEGYQTRLATTFNEAQKIIAENPFEKCIIGSSIQEAGELHHFEEIKQQSSNADIQLYKVASSAQDLDDLPDHLPYLLIPDYNRELVTQYLSQRSEKSHLDSETS